jgi:adenylate kinase
METKQEPTRIYKILLMGPQGSGKGTQADLLSDKIGIPAYSMGQLLRDEVASDSNIGKKVASILEAGELVDDEVAAEVLKKRLENDEEAENGYILDGYPRNMSQFRAFDFDDPTDVMVLEVPDEASIERLSGRLTCDNCGAVYSEDNGYAVGDDCEECDGELMRREDDKPEAIKRRLEIYHEKTEPVIDLYAEMDIVEHIDGVGSIEVVNMRILDALGIEY